MKLIKESIALPERYSVPEDAATFRQGLLIESQSITAVIDAATHATAAAVGSEIQKHLGEVEAARQELTAPLLAAQRKLMELSRAHCEPLVQERGRLENLVSGFRQAERQRVEEAERKRAEEIRRLEEEAQAALRQQEQAMAAAARLESAEELSGEEQAIVDAQVHSATQAAETAEAASYAAMVAPVPAPTKARGASTGDKLQFEVTDIHQLYAARPELCKPPEAKASAIRAVCQPTDVIPGLRLWSETKTSFRK